MVQYKAKEDPKSVQYFVLWFYFGSKLILYILVMLQRYVNRSRQRGKNKYNKIKSSRNNITLRVK